MGTIRPNALRVKRFRVLKADLRTKRDRLLVGIDIAKARHVAQVRLAHTRILDKQLPVPNTEAGFEAFWAQLAQRRAETGVTEIVCAVEPTGTYHQALATFLEAHGVDVVLVCNHVAALNRRTLDRTWGKSDPKDAHNLCDLLERGHVLFYSLPDARTANPPPPRAAPPAGADGARRLPGPFPQHAPPHARARGRTAAARARGEPPRPAAPALPGGRGGAAPRSGAGLPPGLASELTDLVARLTAVQARIAQLEAARVQVAEPLPAYALLRTIPGLGPTRAASLLAELGDITWYAKFSQLRKLAGLAILWGPTGN